jgi:RHS repeat-associated protein
MGCKKLHTDFFNFLEIIHSKKRASEEKKCVNYYPFGLEHKGYNNVVNGTEHPYKFGGKEHNEEFGLDWYDFGARNYDASLGRWMNLDPLAEQMRRHSPYNYAFNKPMRFTDPDGMAPIGTMDDPIYGKNFWGNLKLIGDDGKDAGRVYFVKGDTKRAVKRATKNGETYSGSLGVSDYVASVSANIKDDVVNSVNETVASGRENGGHMMKGGDSATRWDEGPEAVPITTPDGKGAKASIIPFKVDGKIDAPSDKGDVDTYWHVHPDTNVNGVQLGSSTPSGKTDGTGDINFQKKMESNGFKGSPFVIGAGDNTVRFYNSEKTIITVKYSQFIDALDNN